MTLRVLYINSNYDNLCTIDHSVDDGLAEFGQLTYRQLADIIFFKSDGEEVDPDELDELGITGDQIDEYISDEILENHYSRIDFEFDNRSGPEAKLFDLVRELKIFKTDRDGNGIKNGIEMIQSTADGPSKRVYAADQKAAEWLVKKLLKKGIDVRLAIV